MPSTSATPLTRRERKKQDRIRQVRDLALELFVEKGFNAVTVDEIAEAADIGRASFFNYFPTKDAVLRSYHFWIYDQMHEFAEQLSGDSGRELFRQYYRHLTRMIEREGDRYRMLHGILNVRADLREEDKDAISACSIITAGLLRRRSRQANCQRTLISHCSRKLSAMCGREIYPTGCCFEARARWNKGC